MGRAERGAERRDALGGCASGWWGHGRLPAFALSVGERAVGQRRTVPRRLADARPRQQRMLEEASKAVFNRATSGCTIAVENTNTTMSSREFFPCLLCKTVQAASCAGGLINLDSSSSTKHLLRPGGWAPGPCASIAPLVVGRQLGLRYFRDCSAGLGFGPGCGEDVQRATCSWSISGTRALGSRPVGVACAALRLLTTGAL